jgi:hypothetical protein
MFVSVLALPTKNFDVGHKILSKAPDALRNRLLHTNIFDGGRSRAPPASPLLRVSPMQFGGDPTGLRDSTDALQKALQICINASKLTKGHFPVNIRDAGGCTVDPEGGEFLMSKPLIIPTYTANMQIRGGSLVANPTSPAWRAVLPKSTPSTRYC